MVNEKNDIVTYLFKDSFVEYEPLFSKHCPPPYIISKGTLIEEKGVSKGWMYYIFDGMVKVFISNFNGYERIIAYLKKGALIAIDCFDENNSALLTSQCITDTKCVPFNKNTVRIMMGEDLEFGIKMMSYYTKVMRQFCFDTENHSIGVMSIMMANYLYMYINNNDSEVINMSQQELAYAIGCSPSSVSRIFEKFKNEGILRKAEKGFRIMNNKKLLSYCRF